MNNEQSRAEFVKFLERAGCAERASEPELWSLWCGAWILGERSADWALHCELDALLATAKENQHIVIEIFTLLRKIAPGSVSSFTLTLSPNAKPKGGDNKMNAQQLPVGGLLVTPGGFVDAKGNALTLAQVKASGAKMVYVVSDETFATYVDSGDGFTGQINPVDPTAQAAGSATLTGTLTNADGTQCLGVAMVADSYDVTGFALTLSTPPAAAASP